jgi:protein gp37
MSDLFHEEVPLPFIEQVFEVMRKNERHTFQILTKRHIRLAELASFLPWPPNVWMGVSVENQLWANRRIPYLKRVPAAVRFLSCEPLLRPIDLWHHLDGIHWVIVGGESGPRARPLDLDWIRDLRDQCQARNVPFLLKQLGGHPNHRGHNEALLDGRLWREMPETGLLMGQRA